MSREIEMAPLTPNENLSPEEPKFKVYCDALNSAFSNPQIRNLALSGSLGSGKSSIIRSYDRYKNNEKRFLYISLIDFSRLVKDAKADQNDQRQLEYSLLNQILSYCTTDDLPEGSIAGIPEKTEFLDFRAKGLTVLSITAFILIFHEKFGALATMFGVAEPLRSNMHPLLYLCAAIVLCCYIYPILRRCLPYLRLSKLLLKSKIADAEVNLGKERTTLDAYKFELAYILERIGDRHDRTVVFEDLERLDPDIAIDIMSKLRELNNLTNNHLQRQHQSQEKFAIDIMSKPRELNNLTNNHLQRQHQSHKEFVPIRFIYAISDTTMPALYQTKFYDCIIPVVPVSHPLNSDDTFTTMLNELDLEEEWKAELCDALSDAFVDYRTLLSLKNEFLVYQAYYKTVFDAKSSQRSETASFNNAVLLAITAYKILLPEWFEHALSPQGDGILPNFSSAEEQEKLKEHLKQHDLEKAFAAVRKLFDIGLLDDSSMRLIIGESELIALWLKKLYYALGGDISDKNDQARITTLIRALSNTFKNSKLDPSKKPYADFRQDMIDRLEMLSVDDTGTLLFLFLVESLSAVSRQDVPEDWSWSTELADYYQKCLDNRYKAQALPKSSRTQHPKNVHDRFTGNEEIALRYANGLVNLSCMQELPKRAVTIALLKELQENYWENREIAQICNRALALLKDTLTV